MIIVDYARLIAQNRPSGEAWANPSNCRQFHFFGDTLVTLIQAGGAMPKLTKRTVDAASIKKKPYFIWCGELPGFGVRVFPSNKRVYYADYRNKTGGRKRISIGHHGKLTTDEPRKLAIVTLGDVIKGEHPALDHPPRPNSPPTRPS